MAWMRPSVSVKRMSNKILVPLPRSGWHSASANLEPGRLEQGPARTATQVAGYQLYLVRTDRGVEIERAFEVVDGEEGPRLSAAQIAALFQVERRGRPAKTEAARRTRRMVFLATEAEEAAILACVPPGRDFSDWAREQLLDK